MRSITSLRERPMGARLADSVQGRIRSGCLLTAIRRNADGSYRPVATVSPEASGAQAYPAILPLPAHDGKEEERLIAQASGARAVWPRWSPLRLNGAAIRASTGFTPAGGQPNTG